MLKTLTVWNFALLEHVQVEFKHGLNILTGETGAGKSILIDALGAILGQRVSADAVRTGCDWLRVEAVFVVEEDMPSLHAFLKDQSIDMEDGMLIVTRQVARNGRGTVLVNGRHITLAALKQMGALLVDIHGQNENLALLKEENQFRLVDAHESRIAAALKRYADSYAMWQKLSKEYIEKEQASREYEQRLDMLHWQNKEITDAQLKDGEDEAIENELRKLSHAEKIAGFVEESYNLLNTSNKGRIGILSALSTIQKDLSDMSRYDDTLTNAQKIVEEAFVSLQEASYEIRDYGESMEFNPERLNELQRRMDVLYRLRKKYGATITDVLVYQENVQKELSMIENYDADMEALQQAITKYAEKMKEHAVCLMKLRLETATKLSREIGDQLQSLGMPKARFQIKVEPIGNYTLHGCDKILMYFSANLGENMKSLQKVASGGELSRIALAIKVVSASHDGSVPSMVFDEIDTGIGGRTAQMVAERIALVAQYKQVLCITHLPQIACMADAHLYIAKKMQNGTTVTNIMLLSEREQISEIARMASGADMTAASLENAREMLSHARAKKQTFAQKKM
ncbi:DNA repair protein RecN [uncultured Mitsuokella sp.]|uniref:DNA repair protein RecN n=1 Tax=uncultured Mitsuokella sp. TaxID=453120 RepID=UPI002617335A|nr:DNA repair protein RecN [uncultured Mitsuokella sp.]